MVRPWMCKIASSHCAPNGIIMVNDLLKDVVNEALRCARYDAVPIVDDNLKLKSQKAGRERRSSGLQRWSY